MTRGRRELTTILVVLFLMGIPLFIIGALSNDPTAGPNGYAGAPLIAVACVLMGVPALIAAVWIAVSLGRSIVADIRRYAAWKATLTPQERVLVNVAEAAVLAGAHEAWAAHNREVSRKLAASIIGHDPSGTG